MPNAPRPRSHATQLLAVVLCLFAIGFVVPQTAATGGPKVVVVVGPVGSYNATYRREANLVVAEARRYTANVVLIRSPKATWARVRAAARGASIFVFFGHGNGYPSVYGRFHGDTKNGMGLDPSSGADMTRHVNYGEDRIRASIRFAPNAAVLLYRLCYASGNTQPGMSEGTTSQSKKRVDGYGSGFLAAGAGIVFADGHPKSVSNYVRQLFTTDRTMLDVFRAAPNFHRHTMGPYASARTRGKQYVLDPDRAGSDPSGFYRSVVGTLALTTRAVTQRPPDATPTPEPSDDPSASPEPSAGDDPSASPEPPPSAEPTASPEPTASAEPTEPPGPTPSPEPTASVGPTPTAHPTASPRPLPTAHPTATADA